MSGTDFLVFMEELRIELNEREWSDDQFERIQDLLKKITQTYLEAQRGRADAMEGQMEAMKLCVALMRGAADG